MPRYYANMWQRCGRIWVNKWLICWVGLKHGLVMKDLRQRNGDESPEWISTIPNWVTYNGTHWLGDAYISLSIITRCCNSRNAPNTWRSRESCTIAYILPVPSHYINQCHWNKNVVILTKFSSLAALEVVILTTSSAASDEHFIKMKTFPFQWLTLLNAISLMRFHGKTMGFYGKQSWISHDIDD